MYVHVCVMSRNQNTDIKALYGALTADPNPRISATSIISICSQMLEERMPTPTGDKVKRELLPVVGFYADGKYESLRTTVLRWLVDAVAPVHRRRANPRCRGHRGTDSPAQS